jgi:hypothetical protein
MAPTLRHVMLLAWCAVLLLPAHSAISSTDCYASQLSGFVANQGQWPDSVCFSARSSGVSLWFCTGSVHYYLRHSRTAVPHPTDQLPIAAPRLGPDKRLHVALNWTDGVAAADVSGSGRRTEYVNIYRGSDPGSWRSNVAVYDTITYHQIYEGIDVRYYFSRGSLEYDIIAAPGADVSRLQFEYTGADSVYLTGNGELAVATGSRSFVETPPRVFQPSPAASGIVTAHYRRIDRNRFGFEIEDAFNPTLALIIDPVLNFSSYMGGGDVDHISSLDLGEDGSVYMTGATSSVDFPFSRPGSQTLLSSDVFVTRLSSDGQTVLSTTIFGGGGEDVGFDLALIPDGSICVTGKTASVDFPLLDSLQPHGGGEDAFVVRLSASGDQLLFGSYLGGTGMDKAVAVDIDPGGNLWLYGETDSPDFPTVNPITGDRGDIDLFLTRFTVDSPTVLLSTYFGGDDRDHAGDMAVGGDGGVYFTGQTLSANFPTVRAFDTYLPGWDAFVTKLIDAPPTIVYSSYLSGNDEEFFKGVDVDILGRAYAVGYSYSSDFPTVHPALPDLPGSDIVVSVVSADGTRLEFSTYLGGSGEEAGYDIDVAPAGNFVVTGISSSEDFPAVRSLQGAAGSYDIPLCHMTADSLGIIFSSLLGGTGFDNGTSVLLQDGSIWLGGYTASDDFPTTLPLQATLDGSSDGVVSYIECCAGRRGDIDYQGGLPTEVDSSDLGALVSFLFSPPFTVGLPCTTEADVDGGGGANPVDSSDLGVLVNYLFSPPGSVTLQSCP